MKYISWLCWTACSSHVVDLMVPVHWDDGLKVTGHKCSFGYFQLHCMYIATTLYVSLILLRVLCCTINIDLTSCPFVVEVP